MLSSGIPTLTEYQALDSEPFYRELLRHSRKFEQRCQAGSVYAKSYSRKWVRDPFLQWSRRWEYVYTAQRLLSWASTRPSPITVVDAGSGFTFFPFYLMQTNPALDVDCYDNDPTAGRALQSAADVIGMTPGFRQEDLESLRTDDASADAVYSVSVIEHTRHPRKVIDEVHRVLRPGGLFVCTFDISFETRSPMHWSRVDSLVAHAVELFDVSEDWQAIDFRGIEAATDIVTTAWVAETGVAALPWSRPRLVWLYDLLRGRPRGTLFRPMTFCCATFTKR